MGHNGKMMNRDRICGSDGSRKQAREFRARNMRGRQGGLLGAIYEDAGRPML